MLNTNHQINASEKPKMWKKETTYCWFLLALLTSYNVYFYLNMTADYVFWFFVFFLCYVISIAVVVIRSIRWIRHRQPMGFLRCHLGYLIFSTVFLIYSSEFNYARRYVEARVYFARESALCQVKAKQSEHVEICQAISHEPYTRFILVDPQHELLKPPEQWRASTRAYLNAQKSQEGYLIGSCQTHITHFFDDVFYVNVRCQ